MLYALLSKVCDFDHESTTFYITDQYADITFFYVAGKYCNGTTIEPAECPTGSYCPNGTMFSTQYLCPVGTFNNGTSQTSHSSCTRCWPGYYCEREGLSEPSGVCDPGFYCAGGAAMKRPGDFGILHPNAANTSCHSQCVCPAFNTTTGTYKMFR